MPYNRRRSSTKVSVPLGSTSLLNSSKRTVLGTWSVKEGDKYVAEGITEDEAWKIYLSTINDAQLLNMKVVMSKRTGFR